MLQSLLASQAAADNTPATTQASSASNLNLFVANLSNDVTDDMLLAAFQPYGKIMSSKVMLDIHTGVSRGFGFVLFDNAEDGAKAMAGIHGTVIGQKQVYISVAQTNGLSGLQQTPKMYVRNVPKALSLDFLRTHFQQFGEIARINFRDDQTQANAPAEHRSYLATTTIIFIEFRTSAQAEEAVRVTHNSRPWPQFNMEVPLLAKPAETSQMRNERRQRQATKSSSTGSQPRGSTSSYNLSTGSTLNGSSTTHRDKTPTMVTMAPFPTAAAAPLQYVGTSSLASGVPTHLSQGPPTFVPNLAPYPAPPPMTHFGAPNQGPNGVPPYYFMPMQTSAAGGASNITMIPATQLMMGSHTQGSPVVGPPQPTFTINPNGTLSWSAGPAPPSGINPHMMMLGQSAPIMVQYPLPPGAQPAKQ